MTISFDPDFIAEMDEDRGKLSRGKFLEALMPSHESSVLVPGETVRGMTELRPVSRSEAARISPKLLRSGVKPRPKAAKR